MVKRIALVVPLVSLCVWPSAPLLAQTAQDKAVAESLFREARELRKHKKTAEACEKLEASQKLDPAAGTLLNVGDCYEALGRTASAWATFSEAVSWARRTYDERKENEARRRAKALEARLPRILVEVPKESRLPDLKVTRDGAGIDPAIFGAAVPVDPGPHEVRAEASGRQPFLAAGTLEDGKTWRVTVPTLEVRATKPEPRPATRPSPPPKPEAKPTPATRPVPRPSPPPPTTAPAAAVPAAAPAAPEEGADKRAKGWRTLGIVIGSVGLAATVVGLTFGAKARGTWRDAQAHCDGGLCWDEEGVKLADEAVRSADLATYLVVGGVVIGALGFVVWSASSPSEPPSKTATAVIRGLPGGGVLSLEGTLP